MLGAETPAMIKTTEKEKNKSEGGERHQIPSGTVQAMFEEEFNNNMVELTFA